MARGAQVDYLLLDVIMQPEKKGFPNFMFGSVLLHGRLPNAPGDRDVH